jgi:hypothetical protein
VKAQFQKELDTHKALRLACEQEERISRRIPLAMAKYHDFLRLLPGDCQPRMPSAREACLVLSPLRSAIEEESGSSRDDDDLFKYAIYLLPEAILEWQARRVNQIDELISTHDIARSTGQAQPAPSNPEALVFNCCYRSIYGRKEMLAHHCSSVHFTESTKRWRLGTETLPTIDRRMSPRLESLMLLAGVDNVQDLYLSDMRVVCGACPVKYENKVPGRTAMTWRQCVGRVLFYIINEISSRFLQIRHVDSYHAYSARAFELQLLTAEETAWVRAHEVLHRQDQDGWACAHCTAHLEVQVVKGQVRLHLEQECVFDNIALILH